MKLRNISDKQTTHLYIILYAILIGAVGLSCTLFQFSNTSQGPNVNQTSPQTIYSTVITSTSIATGPPYIAISNYSNFAPLHQWNAENIINITGIALSPDSTKVALITAQYKNQWWLELRDAENGSLIWDESLGEKAAYNNLAFSPDGSLIAVGLDRGRILIWNAANGELSQTLVGHKYAVRVLAFSPDGTKLASGASDNTARVWNVSNGANLEVYTIKTDVRDIAWSPDSRYLAVTSNKVIVFDTVEGGDSYSVFYDTGGDTKDLGEVAFSPNGILLLGAGSWYNSNNNKWRYRIFLWDFPYNTSNPTKIPIDDAVEDTVISPDGQIMLGVYKDKGRLLIFNIVRREIVGDIDIGPKLYMSYSPDISTFAVVSTKTTVTIWHVAQ